MKFSKTDLILRIVETFDFPTFATKAIVDSFFSSIVKLTKNGSAVKVARVGVFDFEHKPVNVHGRNPTTNKPLGFLVGGGYRLTCKFDTKPIIDSSLVMAIHVDTGYDVTTLDQLVLFCGCEIRRQLDSGKYFIARGFGTIKKRGSTPYLIFRCAPALISKTFPN